MGLYNFKDKYFRYDGLDINNSGSNVKFVSLIGSKNSSNGSRTNPYPLNISTIINIAPGYTIFGNGYFAGYMSLSGQNGLQYIIGQGMNNTILNSVNINMNQSHLRGLQDLTIDGFVGFLVNCSICNCDIKTNGITGTLASPGIINSIIRVNTFPALASTVIGANNSYVGVAETTLKASNLLLYDNCNIQLTSANITSSGYYNLYIAFNNCKLRIGSEPDYTPLSGTTEVELRANFVTRCTAQGITVSDITDMGETLKQGRWVFSNSSCIDGLVLKNSVIHNFEKRRLIYFGYSDSRLDRIAITTDKSVPAAFSPGYANSSIAVTNDSIALASDVDISMAVKGQADTNIIWLGGKSQFNKLDIIQNFPKSYGVFVDSSPSLSSTPVNKNGGIVPYENGVQRTYLVRSNDDLEATIAYNGVNYSSAISSRNNIFRGVSNVTSFTTVTANAVVYEILDEVMHQTIQMRIVNKIPDGDIAAGTALTDEYWYLVEHDTDQSNTTDYVTYGGTNYPVGSSFLASGTGSFTKSGNVHLRRCWHKDFDWSTMNPTDADYNFWQNEQKPKWFDVLPDDLRCLMKYNNGMEIEMQTDTDGNYIASGHVNFYQSILEISGNPGKPAYPIKGSYMQLRLVVTSQNPV